mgnify:CR=1 FL=1|jgi:hypothetical protein
MLRYKMKDMTLCIVCVILGIMLSTIFKTACGCRNIEGFVDGGAARGDHEARKLAHQRSLMHQVHL